MVVKIWGGTLKCLVIYVLVPSATSLVAKTAPQCKYTLAAGSGFLSKGEEMNRHGEAVRPGLGHTQTPGSDVQRQAFSKICLCLNLRRREALFRKRCKQNNLE